ncbi:DUF3775 domain-containing protein [Stenotrophomonas sp.]|uniref:DUF3775 domain-containing protein n=1 Tax=Stenotrophomonas sp. TaxID=69392 RepID=UPI003D0C6DAB
MSTDSVSSTVDLVRRTVAPKEAMSKARDAIALMLYGRTFSTAVVAGAQGKLPAARVDRDALGPLSLKYGHWVFAASDLAEQLLAPPQLPCKALSYWDIVDICRIAEERDRVQMDHVETEGELAGTMSITGFRAGMPLRNALQNRLAKLAPEALIELKALVWIGRGDAGRYDAALSHAGQHTAGDVQYLAAKAPLHKYLRKGVERLNRRAASVSR